MNNPRTENIKEIAEQLDCGFRAYMHMTTGQLLFVPDEDSLPGIELDSWENELDQIENNGDDYYEFDKWTSNESFEMMSEFADQLTDHHLQSRLLDALRRNKPFREFKFVIDNSGKCRQQWFDFKNKWQQEFVAQQLNRLKSTDK